MSTPPPTSTPSPPAPLPASARRTTTAAAIFIVMFVVSATGALWSGWLLMHGEDTDPVFGALPGDCDAVVLLDRPSEAGPALQRLAKHPGTPTALAALAQAWVAPLTQSGSLAGLDHGQAWAVCRRGPLWLAALPAADGGDLPLAKWLPAWQAGLGLSTSGTWSARAGVQVQTASDGTVLAAAKSAPGLWVAAFRAEPLAQAATASADPIAALAGLAVADAPVNLSKDKEFRESIERVGGGQARVFVRGGVARHWLAAQLPEQGSLAPWREGLPHLTWVAAALRDDGEVVRVQAHLGTGQKGVIFLKDHLDIQADQDMAALLPAAVATAGQAGVVRLPRRSWPMLTATLAPSSQLQSAFPNFSDRRDWQQWLLGPVAWVKPGPCVLTLAPLRAGAQVPADAPTPQGDSNCPLQRRIVGAVAVVGTKDDLERASAWLADPAQQLRGADADLGRLARDTQGWTAWSDQQRAQLDWVWLDTGVAGALTVWPKK
ncbi:MAG: hypothetical protein HY902_13380 [Deltaproteobacteria bacterium]|nr:hypothetical protein [Deltaproteobacteria bacterium]